MQELLKVTWFPYLHFNHLDTVPYLLVYKSTDTIITQRGVRNLLSKKEKLSFKIARKLRIRFKIYDITVLPFHFSLWTYFPGWEFLS